MSGACNDANESVVVTAAADAAAAAATTTAATTAAAATASAAPGGRVQAAAGRLHTATRARARRRGAVRSRHGDGQRQVGLPGHAVQRRRGRA